MATTEQYYTGDGTTTLFTFPFEYITTDDVKVSLNDVETTAYTYANATTIQMNSAPAVDVRVRIFRSTNVDTLKATFSSGSSIRAKDLNDNFQQNNFAVEEIRNYTWDNEVDTIHSDETWSSSDTKVATTAALDAQFWDQTADTIQSTENFENTDNKIMTAAAIDDRIDHVITNDIGTDGTGITVTDDGDGTITLGLADDSIDFSKIKNDDIITYAEQEQSSVNPADTNIFTANAAARRFDCIVQTSTPTGSTWETGKMWVQNDSDRTVHIWDGTQWLPIASGGAFTTLPKVVYVDSINGDDSYEAHRLSNPKKTIKSAIDDINADPNGDGSIVVVAPGIYGETFPIDIQKNDVAIVGTSLRNCIIHPAIPAADQAGYDVDVPEANELQIMFRVNSGSYFYGLTLQGMKASGTRGGNALDTDATYGLPTNQGWNFAFYPGATIKKSPYIQNCTNFSDSQINNVNFTPHVPGEGAAGDLDSGFAGGGILIDGSTPASNSPLRSMVCDSYTHTALNGPGIFVTNNGYCQATSSYSFFNHFHLKTKNGGQANLAASTTDFGNYSLIADGRSTNAIFTAATTAGASTNDITFTINAPTAGPDWHGSATRPQDNMLVDIGGYTYPVLSAVAAGSGWTVTISRPDPANLSQNLGLQNNVASGASANFYLRSMIASSGHTMEYVGSGTDYRALPENGGVPNEARQKTELNNGKIWAAITDHKGKFIVGDTFSVDQQTGFIETGSGSFAIPRLIVDLDLNGNNISDSTGNVVINDTLSMNSNKIVNVTDPTAAQDAATKAYVDALETSLEGGQLDNLYFRQDTGETINSGDTWSSSDLSIATTAAIDARIVDLVDDVGGFVPINNENSFPATNPDINDGAGTLISIQEISTSRTPSGGTVTIANGSGSNTVTINNCGTTVLAAGYGCIVETTTTLHTYNFHRLTPLATEVSTVAANVTPINTVATNISDVTTVSTDIASVVTVANDLNEPVSEIDTVATNITNVNNVGNNITDVTTVSGSISNVNTVASDITNVNNTGTYIANVNTVAGQISPTNNVATVAGVASSIPTVASVSSSIPTVAGIAANVTTVAGISGNVTTVAGISSDVTAVANNNTDVSTVATNITDVNTFANRYRIASSDPTTSLDTGDLVFNTTSNELRVYNGTAWQGGVTATGNLVSKSGDTMTGDLSFGGSYKATNLATPTATGDAATKGYVDTAVSGIATDIDGLSDGTTQFTENVGLGTNALSSLASGSSQNTALGYSAGQSITTRIYNTFIGAYAGQYVNQSRNTVIGAYAMRGTSGATTCVRNVAIGDQALQSVTTGNDSVVIGSSAGKSLTTGNKSVIIGSSAGYSVIVGTDNVYLGNSTGLYQTNSSNVGIGSQALKGVSGSSTGYNNVAVGISTLQAVTTGYSNVAIGDGAGYSVTTGDRNVHIGAVAGYNNSTANNQICVGYYSGYNSSGDGIIGLGQYALYSTAGSTTGNKIAIGPSAARSVTTGSFLTAIGDSAGYGVTSGIRNIFVGNYAGYTVSTGSNNVAVGDNSLQNGNAINCVAVGPFALLSTTGPSNTAIGYYAGSNITSGSNNVCIGNSATPSSSTVSNEITLGNTSITKFRVPGIDFVLKDNGGTPTTGQVLTADASGEGYWATLSAGATSIDGLSDGYTWGQTLGLGINALANHTSGNYNTAVGYTALYSATTGQNNTSIGYETLYSNTTSSNNTAVGYRALKFSTGQNNTALGYAAGDANTTGANNIFVGIGAGGSSTTGANNVYQGYESGFYQTTSEGNVAIGHSALKGTLGGAAAPYNVAIGYQAGSNTNSSSSVYIGYYAGQAANGTGNTVVGPQAGRSMTAGNTMNTFIGYDAGRYSNVSDVIAIGRLAAGAATRTSGSSYSINIGEEAGYYGAAQAYNICIGYKAGRGSASTTSALAANVYIGLNSGRYTTTAQYNVCSGYGAGTNLTTGSNSVLSGYQAGSNITTSQKNVCIGSQSGSALTAQGNNTFVGPDSGRNAACGNSVLVGTSAGYSASGNSNVVVGYASGNNSSFSGGFNTILGGNAGTTNTTGTFNTVIGYGAEPSSATVSNEITLGGTGTTKFRVPGVGFEVDGTTSADNLKFNSGYGSAATAYGARAWIRFDGSAATIGTGAGSGNMDAVTDNGTGDYTVNFTNNMPDANYAIVVTSANTGTSSSWTAGMKSHMLSQAVGSCRIVGHNGTDTGEARNTSNVNVVVFR